MESREQDSREHLSWRPRAREMLAYAVFHPSHAREHNFARVLLIRQEQTIDVQIRQNWILTSTLRTYPSTRRACECVSLSRRNKVVRVQRNSQIAKMIERKRKGRVSLYFLQTRNSYILRGSKYLSRIATYIKTRGILRK